ncbi:UNVERIFIED_CONTAM: hypothetical protein HDU68_005303, partial [Siphonaria sp. JEL0065]
EAEADRRRQFFDDRIRKQQEAIDRMAELLIEKRVMMEQKMKDLRKERLDERRHALTSIHSDKVKVHGDNEKRVNSAHVMLASAIANTRMLEKEVRGKSRMQKAPPQTFHKKDGMMQVEQNNSGANSFDSGSLEVSGDRGSVTFKFPTSARKQSVAFKGLPFVENTHGADGIVLENNDPPIQLLHSMPRKPSVSLGTRDHTGSRQESAGSQYSAFKMEMDADDDVALDYRLLPKQKTVLYRGSAYKRQVQELAQIKAEYNPDLIPTAKRYDALKIKEAIHRKVNYDIRKTQSADPRLSNGYPTEALLRSYKQKYLTDRVVVVIKEKPSMKAKVEEIQNTVFQRLSQKKHMLVQASKNRKKASKYNFNERNSMSVTSGTGGARFSTVAMTDVKSGYDHPNPYDNFGEDDHEEQEEEEEEEEVETVVKVQEPAQEWNNPKSIALIKCVQEKVKEGRRGPKILTESPVKPTSKATANARASMPDTSCDRGKSASSTRSQSNAGTPRNIRSARLIRNTHWEEDESEIEDGLGDFGKDNPGNDLQNKSIVREQRATSAGGRVTFDMNKSTSANAVQAVNLQSNLGEIVVVSDSDGEGTFQTPMIFNDIPRPRDTYSTHQFKCEKWEPLRLSALDDFKKTIIPSCMKRPPRINDIAVAVEERISLPKIMRVWLTPDIDE